MKRVAIVIGTRPEAIKLAPVAQALIRRPGIDVRIVATAQHREMLDQSLAEMRIVPDVDLDLMEPAQTLSAFTGRCISALGALFARERPDHVIGQGDTATAFCAALVAFHARIDFGHVEAGLRSGSPDAPFPEETYRSLVGRLARHHFCPTPLARANLLAENVDDANIHVVGNTVIDTLLATSATLPPRPDTGHPTILVTIHRRENVERLPAMLDAVQRLLAAFPTLRICWPVHLNPRLAAIIHAALGRHPRVNLAPPLGYRAFVRAMRDASLILTDSGGVQEEAPALGTPVLVLRDQTERPEGIVAGVAKLVGTDPDRIVAMTSHLLQDREALAGMAQGTSPYGDGRAGTRIADIVEADLLGTPMPMALRIDPAIAAPLLRSAAG